MSGSRRIPLSLLVVAGAIVGASEWHARAQTAVQPVNDLPNPYQTVENYFKVTSFGEGLLVFPHGIHVDPEGNVWVTDGNDNRSWHPTARFSSPKDTADRT